MFREQANRIVEAEDELVLARIEELEMRLASAGRTINPVENAARIAKAKAMLLQALIEV